MFYCALNETEAIAWQDGEQGEPLAFQPTFVCEWDGVSNSVSAVFGSFTGQIPFAGWPAVEV